MTIEEAERNYGRAVIYMSESLSSPEYGVIVGTSTRYVFVLYQTGSPKATHPEDLELTR